MTYFNLTNRPVEKDKPRMTPSRIILSVAAFLFGMYLVRTILLLL